MPNIHKLNNGLTVITDYIDTVETCFSGHVEQSWG
jgi:hypothetical protein